jgi:hypothetical protein
MDVHARPLRQPPPDERRLVRAVVIIRDQVHVDLRGHGGADGIKELRARSRDAADVTA